VEAEQEIRQRMDQMVIFQLFLQLHQQVVVLVVDVLAVVVRVDLVVALEMEQGVLVEQEMIPLLLQLKEQMVEMDQLIYPLVLVVVEVAEQL
tara:strand:- start:281 stop:556 length:276 start_codon:yes stop_codon:yes gene_type:complete